MQTRVDTIRTEIDRTEMNVNVRYRCSTISEKGLMVVSIHNAQIDHISIRMHK